MSIEKAENKTIAPKGLQSKRVRQPQNAVAVPNNLSSYLPRKNSNNIIIFCNVIQFYQKAYTAGNVTIN
jgi:hypothetical protein